MRKTLLLTVALAPVVGFAALTIPVAAESAGGSDVSQPANDTLNLDAIPIKPVNGPLAVQGVSDEEDDDLPMIGGSDRKRLRISLDDEGDERGEHHAGYEDD